MQECRNEGRKEGRKEGRNEGMKEGRKAGRKEGDGADIKSNNPHLTGGEKGKIIKHYLFLTQVIPEGVYWADVTNTYTTHDLMI